MLTFCKVCIRRAWNDSSWCWRAYNKHGMKLISWNCYYFFLYVSPKVAYFQKGSHEGQRTHILSHSSQFSNPFSWRFLWKAHVHLGNIYSEKDQPLHRYLEKIRWNENELTFNADCGWIWFSDSDMQPYSKKQNWKTMWSNS